MRWWLLTPMQSLHEGWQDLQAVLHFPRRTPDSVPIALSLT